MNRSHLPSRFLALFLAFVLALPSSAYALKPPETSEAAGLEQLSQALTPSAGLEERFGLSPDEIRELAQHFEIVIPQKESSEGLRELKYKISHALMEGDPSTKKSWGGKDQSFLKRVLIKLSLGKQKSAVLTQEWRKPGRHRVTWALAVLLGVITLPAVPLVVDYFLGPKPQPVPTRPIDSAPAMVTKTQTGTFQVAMVPGALRIKLPDGFAGKPVRGFFLLPPLPERRVETAYWLGSAPAERTVPQNGVLHFEAERSSEKSPGYDWPKARRRVLVVFDGAKAAEEMTSQVFKNVPPEPEKFRGVLLFLEIGAGGTVKVLYPKSGLEERRVDRVKQEIRKHPPVLSAARRPIRFEIEVVSNRTPQMHLLEAENGQVLVHLHVFEGDVAKHGLLFRLNVDDAGTIRGIGEVLVESHSYMGSPAYNEFVVLDQIEGLPEPTREQLQEAAFRVIQDHQEELQAAVEKMRHKKWRPIFVLARSVTPEEPGLWLMVWRKWLRADQRFFMHPTGIVYERQDLAGPRTPGQQHELESLLAASGQVKEADSRNNPKPYFDALIRQLFAGRNVSIAMRGEMKSPEGLHELVLLDGNDPNNWTGLHVHFSPASVREWWFVYFQEWESGRRQGDGSNISYQRRVTLFEDQVRMFSTRILRHAENSSVVPTQEDAHKILEAISPSKKSSLEERFVTLEKIQEVSSWRGIFGDDHPVAWEVGFESGDALYERAVASPGVNFLGIDVSDTALRKQSGKHVPEGFPDNVRFLKADVHDVVAALPPPLQRLSAVYVDFPYPPELLLDGDAANSPRYILESQTIVPLLRFLTEGGEFVLRTESGRVAYDFRRAVAQTGNSAFLQSDYAVHQEGFPKTPVSLGTEADGTKTYLMRYRRPVSSVGLEEMLTEKDLIGRLMPMTFPKWMEIVGRRIKDGSLRVQHEQWWQSFVQAVDPRTRRFFSQEGKGYARRFSGMSFKELLTEGLRFPNQARGIRGFLFHVLQEGKDPDGMPHLKHRVEDILNLREKLKQQLAAGGIDDQTRITLEQIRARYEEEWVFLLEVMHRWDDAPKFRSHVLFDNRIVVVDAAMIEQVPQLEALLRDPAKLGEYRRRVVVLGSLPGENWPDDLLVAHSAAELPEVIPNFERRRAFLTLTFLGSSDIIADQIRSALSSYAASGLTFLYDPKLANPDALKAFLLDGLGMPVDQADALTTGMEEQSLVGRQA